MVVETKITVDRDNPDLHLVDRGRFAYRFLRVAVVPIRPCDDRHRGHVAADTDLNTMDLDTFGHAVCVRGHL